MLKKVLYRVLQISIFILFTLFFIFIMRELLDYNTISPAIYPDRIESYVLRIKTNYFLSFYFLSILFNMGVIVLFRKEIRNLLNSKWKQIIIEVFWCSCNIILSVVLFWIVIGFS